MEEEGFVFVEEMDTTKKPVSDGSLHSDTANDGTHQGTPLLRFINPRAVFIPDFCDEISEVLLGGGKIVGVSKTVTSSLSALSSDLLCTIDLKHEYFITPGLVDIHVHATGGGGEDGFHSRVPEACLSELIEGGVTACVGVLGTDTVTRSNESLLAKMRALAEDGLTTYMWVGGYSVPPPLLTDSIKSDLTLIPEVIGVGELAVSDHRSSNPSENELDRIAAEARVGGMCTGKGGVTYFHMGDHDTGLEPLVGILTRTAIPVENLLPTHMDRTPELLNQGIKWVRERRGKIDFSGDPETVVPAVAKVLDEPECDRIFDNVSVSSDAYGSIPVFDKQGQLVSYSYNKPSLLLEYIETLVTQRKCESVEHGITQVSKIIAMFTKNPAKAVKVKHGLIEKGGQADILIFRCTEPQQENDVPFVPSVQNLTYVVANGKILKSPGYVKHDMFGR